MNIFGTNSILFCVLTSCLSLFSPIYSQEAVEPKIDFTTTIKPILEQRCISCHNENDEEGGLNLEDTDAMMEYITAEKPQESGLYQSLTGANDLPQMPPEEDNEGQPLSPCSQSEMAAIYLWIQQGASLEGVELKEAKEETRSAVHRLFLFSGYFHPAIVHFPIALITMSAVFIILFFKNDALSDDAAFYLLLFGTLSAIVACVFGWAFAEKNPVAVTDFSIGINRHRWIGIVATILALISTIIGWRSRNEIMEKSRSGMWKFGVVLTAALMGLVGHQGGEEVYGEGMYERAAVKLIPEFWPFGGDPEKENDPEQDADSDSKNQKSNNDNQAQPNPGTGNKEDGNNGDGNGDKENGNNQSQDRQPSNDQDSLNGSDQKDQKTESDKNQSSPPSDPTLKNDSPQ